MHKLGHSVSGRVKSAEGIDEDDYQRAFIEVGRRKLTSGLCSVISEIIL